mmetsp:Transcript_8664/g.12830  ORF Transcript_8664/g.12830 Transcript_8664/m.12830 type:complete len:80 (+) Transcript_8664:475-714(+)
MKKMTNDNCVLISTRNGENVTTWIIFFFADVNCHDMKVMQCLESNCQILRSMDEAKDGRADINDVFTIFYSPQSYNNGN